MALTLKEFSELCGIPRTTISRALNDYPHVSDKMKKRVIEAARKHGYQANILAKSLVKKQTSLLAFIVPDIRITFFNLIVDLLERETSKKGLNLLIFNSFNDPGREKRILELIQQLRVDTLIFAPVTSRSRLANRQALKSTGVRTIFFDTFRSNSCSYVLLDNTRAGELAADYLFSLGHRCVGMVESPEDKQNVAVRERREGFIDRCRRNGVKNADKHLFSSDWPGACADSYYGHETIKPEIQRIRDAGISALFCYTDSIALGVIHALRESGIRVPEDISIVGCDNMDFGRFIQPRLTTVDQPCRDMARALLEAVLKDKGKLQVQLDPKLVIRDSCCPPEDARHGKA